MEPLFKTITKNTLEEYKRFSRKLFLTKKKIIIYFVLILFLILSGIVLKNSFFIVFAIFYPPILLITYDFRIKKVFFSNKVFQNAEVNYEFYDTYFIETNESGDSRVEYSKLYKIMETKKNMYLMISENQGFILVKDNFPEGLIEFLREINI